MNGPRAAVDVCAQASVRPLRCDRAGIALVMSLLVILILECVVLGTVYLSVQERRLADNGANALRLRLAAESAAGEAAAVWPVALDTTAPGRLVTGVAGSAGALATTAIYQRVDSLLVLVFAEAREPAPRLGRARAARLIQPPLFPPTSIPASALTAGGAVRIRIGALLSAVPAALCADDSVGSANALRLPDVAWLQLDDPAALDGSGAALALAPDFRARVARVAAALPPLATFDSTTHTATLAAPGSAGVLAVDGDLVIAAGASFTGLVLATGSIRIEAGASIDGVIVAAGTADLGGTVRLARCAAVAESRTAGLHRPVPLARRPSVPAF